MFRKQQSPCEGDGGLKFEKKNKCWKKIVHTLEKMGIGSPVFCTFFIHPKPNYIGPARQQPRDWGSLLNFSESGRGGHSNYLLALRLLGYMGFAEWKQQRNGKWWGGHTLQPHSLGTGDKYPHPTPNFRVLLGTGRGHKSVLSSDQTTGDLKFNHLQARVTLSALSVPPRQQNCG